MENRNDDLAQNKPTLEYGDMKKEDFRRRGYELIDWISNYFERLEDFPVLSQNQPGEKLAARIRAGNGRKFRRDLR